ncbi:hypothetical protein HZU67_03905 [Apis mellifera carnica]|nr:hypothetical protein HZU67_03905 [Apis mellifera carnica]
MEDERKQEEERTKKKKEKKKTILQRWSRSGCDEQAMNVEKEIRSLFNFNINPKNQVAGRIVGKILRAKISEQ